MISLELAINQLPLNVQKELLDFAEFLKKEYSICEKTRSLKLYWAGGLEKYNDSYELSELQHKISDW